MLNKYSWLFFLDKRAKLNTKAEEKLYLIILIENQHIKIQFSLQGCFRFHI